MLSLSLFSKMPALPLENLTIVLTLMYYATLKSRCTECSRKAFKRLDFTDIDDTLEDEDLELIYSCLEFDDEED